MSGESLSPAAASTEAEVERVIVTGSNVPTAEEVGPKAVDTYRPGDIEKLGVRNSTELLIKLGQDRFSSQSGPITRFADSTDKITALATF